MDSQEKICRLCLKVCDSCKAIKEDLKDALNMVLKRIDLTLIQEPMICTYCAAMLIKCSQFKTTCLITRDCVLPFIDNKNNDVQLNLIEVYLSLSEDGVGLSESQVICGFCMSPVKSCSAIFLDVEWGDVILQKMIEECLPELDFSIIKKPVICPPCRDSLENCFCFVTNCSIIEEKIKKYRESKNINGEGQIELSGLLEFMTGDVTVKVEKEDADEGMSGNEDGVLTVEPMLVDVNRIVKVKLELENGSCTEMHDDVTTKNVLACKRDIKIEETFRGESKLKEETVDVQDQLIEEIDIKTEECDFNRCENDVLPPLEVTIGLPIKQTCLTPALEKDPSKSCITEKTNKGNRPLNTMNKCESCLYQMNDKNCLEDHLHEDTSEVTVYKCDYCPYQTKRKSRLKEHLLKHKDPSEVTMYKCGLCSYQTKLKSSLKPHMLTHKDPSEVEIYKCSLCAFQTKFRKSLNRHKLTHKDPSEVTMYKCDSCLYQTKRKCNLKDHLLQHKDPSEVTMYKCNLCSYQTKYKNYLKEHSLRHKSPSEITMYKCSLCEFQTKFKNGLKQHNTRKHDI